MKKFSLDGYVNFLYAKGISKKTIENYKFLLNHYISWLEENFSEEDFLIITEKEKEDLIRFLKNKGLSENSIKQVLKKAKQFTQFIGGKWITLTPIGTTKLDKKPFTKAELFKVLNFLKKKNLIYYYLGIILYSFGVKPKEINLIKPDDFFIEDNLLFLKINGRKVPAFIFENHKKDLLPFIEKRKNPKTKKYPLFIYYNDLKGKLVNLSYENAKVYFNNVSKELNIDISLKRFRNTYIVNLLQKDINLKIIAKWLGVKSLQSLVGYYDFVNPEEKYQIDKLR